MFEYFPNDIMYAILDNTGNLLAFNNIEGLSLLYILKNIKIGNLHINIKDLFKIEQANQAAKSQVVFTECMYHLCLCQTL